MTTPHNSALQSCQGHLWTQTPSGLSCHIQGHRPLTTVGDKHFYESSGVQCPSLNTPKTWGRFGLAVTDLSLYFTFCSGPQSAFTLQRTPRPAHAVISSLGEGWQQIRKTHQFSLQNQQTYKLIIFSKGPNLCPQNANCFAPACWTSALHCKVLSGRSPARGKLQIFHKGREFLISQLQRFSLWPWTYSKDMPIFQNQNVFIAFYAHSDGNSITLALLSRSIFQTIIWGENPTFSITA